MHIRKLLATFLFAMALQGCGSDSSDSTGQPAEAVYPAGIQSIEADVYNPTDGSVAGTTEIEYSYNDEGGISEQRTKQSAGGNVYRDEGILFNTAGEVEFVTGIGDHDQNFLPDHSYIVWKSYRSDGRLANETIVRTPDDPTGDEVVITTSLLYNDDGKVVREIEQRRVGGTMFFKFSVIEMTYDEADRIETQVRTWDIDGDGIVNRTQTKTFAYDERDRPISVHTVALGEAPEASESTFSYENGNLLEIVEDIDSDGNGLRDRKIVNVFSYQSGGLPANEVSEITRYDANGEIFEISRYDITLSYDGSGRIAERTLEITNRLANDTLLHAEIWNFSYSENDKEAVMTKMVDANGGGESFLERSGTMSMTRAGLFTQVFHQRLDEGVSLPIPLPLAVAKESFFEM